MKGKIYIALAAILVFSLALTACTAEPDPAEVERMAKDMAEGMAEQMAEEKMAEMESECSAEPDRRWSRTWPGRWPTIWSAEEMAKMDKGEMMMEGGRLETVKERGKVICASRNDVPATASWMSPGNNVGFDIDLCRALAAAVPGDPNGH